MQEIILQGAYSNIKMPILGNIIKITIIMKIKILKYVFSLILYINMLINITKIQYI